MAKESPEEQGPERTSPVVVVTIKEDGTVDTRSNMGAYVLLWTGAFAVATRPSR